MNHKLILKSLSKFDLNTYEAKSYISLLEKNNLSAVEVSKISGVPRGRVYEVLDSLALKGLCHSVQGKIKKYRAADPAILQEKTETQIKLAEDEINQKINQEISQKKRELEDLKKNSEQVIKRLIPLYEKSRNNNNSLEYIQVIKDPFYINKKFMELCAKTNKEMVGFSKPPYSFGKKRDPKQIEQQRKLSERGIKIRSIFEIPDSKEEKRWILENEKIAARHGHESRLLKELPMKMAVFDSRIVIFTLEDPVTKQSSITSQIIEHSALAKSFKILFETLWEQAKDYNILKD